MSETRRARGRVKSFLSFVCLLWAVPAWAQSQVIVSDPPPSALVSGFVGGLKISLDSHGDPAQPGAGDAVGLASYADDVLRPRVWSSVFGVSTYSPGPRLVVGQEIDLNNFAQSADPPGFPRSIYGSWITGWSPMPYVGSAAMLITTAPPTRWRTGIYLDQTEVGIQFGGTQINTLGIDLARTRLRFSQLTVPPPIPPPGAIELYAQGGIDGRMQLVVRFPNGQAVVIAEP